MKKVLLILGVSISALLAQGAMAQTDSAGEARAQASKPASKQEKQDAKSQRRATGKELAKEDSGRTDDPASMGVAHGNTKADKQAAKAQRRANGKAYANEAQDKHDAP